MSLTRLETRATRTDLPLARVAAAGFGLAALALRFESAKLRRAARLRLATLLRLVHRRDQHLAQPLHDGGTITFLRAAGFGRQVNLVRLREPPTRRDAQPREGVVSQSVQRSYGHPQLDLRVQLVDVLPPRPAAAGGLEAQARFGDADARRELDAA